MDVFATQAIEDVTDFYEEANQNEEKHQVGILEKEGAVFPIYSGINKLGRDESCDIAFKPEEISVSKFHAVIEASDGDDPFLIYDTKSLNGTFLGKRRLAPGVRYSIDENSVLKLGTVFFTVRKCPAMKPEPIEISDDDLEIVLPVVEKEQEADKAAAVEDDEPCTQFDAASPAPPPDKATTEVPEPKVQDEEEEPCTQFDENEILEENTQFEEEPIRASNMNLKTQESGISTEGSSALPAQTKKRDNILNLETQAEISVLEMDTQAPPNIKKPVQNVLDMETQAFTSPNKKKITQNVLDMETQAFTPSRAKAQQNILEMDTQAFVTPPRKNKPTENILDMETQASTPSRVKAQQNILEMDTQASVAPPQKKKTTENILDMETQDFISPIVETPQNLRGMEAQAFSTPAASINLNKSEMMMTPAFSTPLGVNQSVLDMETQGDLVTSTSNQDILTEDTQAPVFAMPKTPVSSKFSKIRSPVQKSPTQSNISILEMDTQSQAEIIDSSILELETQASDSESSLQIRYVDTEDSIIEDSQKEPETKNSESNILDLETQCNDSILNKTTQMSNDILNQSTQMGDNNDDDEIFNSSFDEHEQINNNKKNSIFNVTTQAVDMNCSIPFTSDDEDDEVIKSTKREVSKIIEKGSQYTDSQATEFDDTILMDTPDKEKIKNTLEHQIVPETQDTELEIIPETQDNGPEPEIILETQDDNLMEVVPETQEDVAPKQNVMPENQEEDNIIPESQDIDDVIEDTPPSSPVLKRKSILSLERTPRLAAVVYDSQATQVAPKFPEDTQATQLPEDTQATQLAPKFFEDTQATQLAPRFIDDSEATQLAPRFDSNTAPTQPISQIITQVASSSVDSEATQLAPTFPDSQNKLLSPSSTTPDTQPVSQVVTQLAPEDSEATQIAPTFTDSEATQVAPKFDDGSQSDKTSKPRLSCESEKSEDYFKNIADVDTQIAPSIPDTQESSTAEDTPTTFSQIERRLAPMFANTQVEESEKEDSQDVTESQGTPATYSQIEKRLAPMFADTQIEDTIAVPVLKPVLRDPSPSNRKSTATKHVSFSSNTLDSSPKTLPKTPMKTIKTVHSVENIPVEKSLAYDDIISPLQPDNSGKQSENAQAKPSEVFDYEESDEGEASIVPAFISKRTPQKRQPRSAKRITGKSKASSEEPEAVASTSAQGMYKAISPAPPSRQSKRRQSSARNRKSESKQAGKDSICMEVAEIEKMLPEPKSSRAKRATKKENVPEKSSTKDKKETGKEVSDSEKNEETEGNTIPSEQSVTPEQQIEVEPKMVPETEKKSQRSRSKRKTISEVKSTEKEVGEVQKKTETNKKGGDKKDHSPERQEMAVSKRGSPRRKQTKRDVTRQQEQQHESEREEVPVQKGRRPQVKRSHAELAASEPLPPATMSPKRSKRATQASTDTAQQATTIPASLPQTENEETETVPGTPKRNQRSRAKHNETKTVKEPLNQDELDENVSKPTTSQKMHAKLSVTQNKDIVKQNEPGTSEIATKNEEKQAPGTPKRSKRNQAKQDDVQNLETAVEITRTPSKSRSRSASTETKSKSQGKEGKAQLPENDLEMKAVEAPAASSQAPNKSRSRSASTETKSKSQGKEGKAQGPEIDHEMKTVEPPAQAPNKNRSRSASTETKSKSQGKEGKAQVPEKDLEMKAAEAPAVSSQAPNKSRSRSASTEAKSKRAKSATNVSKPQTSKEIQTQDTESATESQDNVPVKTLPKRKAKTNHSVIKPVTDPQLPRLNLVIVRENGSGKLKSHLKSTKTTVTPPKIDDAMEVIDMEPKDDTPPPPEKTNKKRGTAKQSEEEPMAGPSRTVDVRKTAKKNDVFIQPAPVESEKPEPSTSLAKKRTKRKTNDSENEPQSKRPVREPRSKTRNDSLSVDDKSEKQASVTRADRSSVSPTRTAEPTKGPRKGRQTKKPVERSKRSSVSPAESISSTRSAGRASSSSISPAKRYVNLSGRQSDQDSLSSVMTNDSTMTQRSVRRVEKSKTLVMFTGFTEDLNKHEQAIKDLGGVVINKVSEKDCILVVKKMQRTLKLLTMLARGLPIVSEKWISDSKKAGYFRDPWKYLIKDNNYENKYGFDLRACLEKRKQAEPVFKGYTIMATPNIKPAPHELKGIVENAGAAFLVERPKLWIKPSLLVTCEEDSDLWNYLQFKGIPNKHRPKLVKVDAIWESIQQQCVITEDNEFSN